MSFRPGPQREGNRCGEVPRSQELREHLDRARADAALDDGSDQGRQDEEGRFLDRVISAPPRAVCWIAIATEGMIGRMGRGRDRGPKRRGFDDDDYPAPTWGDRPQQRSGPPPRRDYAAPSGPPVDATVKWFNPEKGSASSNSPMAPGTSFCILPRWKPPGTARLIPARN